jgi:high affinity Mn2+ porin
VGAQYTFVRQHQTELTSPYEGPRSPGSDGRYAEQPHPGGVPGLGGLPNGDVIRQGAGNLPKRFYIARKFVRYLIPLPFGGTKTAERAQDQLPGAEPAARVEIKAGVLAAFHQSALVDQVRLV